MVHSAPGQLNCRLRLRLTLSLLCTLRAACLGICNLSDENHFLSLSLFLSFSRYSFSVLLSFTPEGRGIGIGGLLPIQQYIQWDLVFCCFFLFSFWKEQKMKGPCPWVSEWAHTRRRRHASPLDLLRVGELRRKKETRRNPSSLGATFADKPAAKKLNKNTTRK